MKLSIISDWINGNISSEKLKTIIDPYVLEFQRKLKIKGTSIPFYLTEDVLLSFGILEFIFFCNAYINGNLNELEASYIAELLLLSPSVLINEEKIKDGLDFFCDIDIYGSFTKEDVKSLLQTIKSK